MTNSLFITKDVHVLLKQEAGDALLLKGGITSEGFAVIHAFHRGWLPFGYLQDVRGYGGLTDVRIKSP